MPQTLLLADDSATIQRVIELTFAGEDIKVVAVSDGDQAIARIQSAPPDIVLADVGMPGKTGYEVAEYVKHTPTLAHIPVVLLTGAFEPVDQAKAAAAGCDGVLAKPFEPQIVIGRVRELLGRPAVAAAAPPPPASSMFDVPESVFANPEPRAASPESRAESPEPRVETSEPRVEDYFDRLDAAFASFSNPSAAPSALDLAPAKQAPEPPPAELDWLRPKEEPPQEQAAPDFAIADELAVEPAVAPPPAEPLPRERPEPIEPVEPRGPRPLPPIAEAFSAILAAEQNALGVRPEWPTPSQQAQAPQVSAELVITDELVERVARRVLEQMSDRVVRETVAQIASDVAERLVREEIERIKASIK